MRHHKTTAVAWVFLSLLDIWAGYGCLRGASGAFGETTVQDGGPDGGGPSGRQSSVPVAPQAAATRSEYRSPFDIAFSPDPGTNRYVATATAHHGQSHGSLVVIDPDVEDDDHMGPMQKLTPEVGFPEANTHLQDCRYGTAWPLNADLFLCVYDPDFDPDYLGRARHGIYVIDRHGNKKLVYRDGNTSLLSPIPLKPRSRPLSVSTLKVPDPPPEAIVSVINVYDSLLPFPEGTRIAALRIVQVLPKSTPLNTEPNIGYRINRNARQVLGTVPVEEDGSAQFKLPIDMPVYLQAVGSDGLVVQSMRSDLYVPRGQIRLTCQGCREPRHRAPAIPDHYPMAFLRQPSTIEPDVEGTKPFSYTRLVQPVLNTHCVPCHGCDEQINLTDELTDNRWYASYDAAFRATAPHLSTLSIPLRLSMSPVCERSPSIDAKAMVMAARIVRADPRTAS